MNKQTLVHMKRKCFFGALSGLVLLAAASCLNRMDPVRVACVGDSITQGVGIANQHRDSYPGLLQQMLGANYEVRNFGYSGRTLLDKGDRPYMKEQMYQDALDFCPDIVTIKLGTNDTKPWNWTYCDEFPENLEKMVNAFKALPSQPEIYLCLPVPAYRLDWGINDSIIHTGVQTYIREVAARTGASVIDLYTPLENRPDLFADRIHPTKEGALVIAGVLYETLTGKKVDPSFCPQDYPGVKSDWAGYDCYAFNYLNRRGMMAVPGRMSRVDAEQGGHPWIWRKACTPALQAVDLALLEQGFFVVYYDVTDPESGEAVKKDADKFYKYLTKHYGLSTGLVLDGFSREDWPAVNWSSVCPAAGHDNSNDNGHDNGNNNGSGNPVAAVDALLNVYPISYE